MEQDEGRTYREGSLEEALRARFGDAALPEVHLSQVDSSGTGDGDPARSPSSGVLGRIDGRVHPASRYRVRREIARGGMGAVFEVWDGDLRRRLAMKVALGKGKDGSSAPTEELDARVLARFLEEAQVTGQLDHPGIVPVHELGLDGHGQVYFTMRLVQGEDLDRVFRRVEAGEEAWTLTRCLGHLLRACEAMAFAHSKGVLHRDLKPANVMVGRFGEVYVMDWGLARVLGSGAPVEEPEDAETGDPFDPETTTPLAVDPRVDVQGHDSDALYTMDGDILGTPSYMSPEQARGRNSALRRESDVYSMGAMLYQLLNGAPPYAEPGRKRSGVEILQDLWAGPPRSLEANGRSIPAQLVAICNKAMSRVPEDRYPDMQALAEDLRAYLENRVVRSYEAGAWAEARMWVRRNQHLAGALAAGLMVLVVGLVASLVLKDQADRNFALAEERRGIADRNAAIADEVNRFLNDDLLASATPYALGIDVKVKDVLELASLELEGRSFSEPLVEAELRRTIGSSLTSLGDYAAATPHVERSWELCREVEGEYAPRTLEVACLVAEVWTEAGRLEEAAALFRSTLPRLLAHFGPESPRSAQVRLRYAENCVARGELDEGHHFQDLAYGHLRDALGAEDDATLAALGQRSNTELALGRLEESKAGMESVLAARRDLHEAGHPALLDAISSLASASLTFGDVELSERLHREGLESREAVFGAKHPDTTIARSGLAVFLESTGRGAEAVPILEVCLEELEASLGTEHLETLHVVNALANAYASIDNLEEALVHLEPLPDRVRRALGEDHPLHFLVLNNLSVLYRDLERDEEAEAMCREALELHTRVLGEDHPDTWMVLENLGGQIFRRGAYGEADEIVVRVLEARRRVLGDDHPDVTKTLFNIAVVAEFAGNSQRAIEHYVQVVERDEGLSWGPSEFTVLSLTSLGDLRRGEGDVQGAIEDYRRAIEWMERFGIRDDARGYVHHQLAAALRTTDEDSEALTHAEAALSVRREVYGDGDSTTRTSLYLVALILRDLEEYERAEPLALEALQAHESAPDAAPSRTQACRDLVISIYERWGFPEKADPWR